MPEQFWQLPLQWAYCSSLYIHSDGAGTQCEYNGKNFKLFAKPSTVVYLWQSEFRFGMRIVVWVREIRFWLPIQMHDGQYTADSIQI